MNNRASTSLHTSRYPIFPFFSHTPKMPHSYSWRDLLSKFKASITVPGPSSDLAWLLLLNPTFSSPTPLPSSSINPIVWDTDNSSVASHHAPIHIHLKDHSKFPNQPQYPISEKYQQGLKPIVTKLLRLGLLHPTHSPYNTPILCVKKPNGSYCLVHSPSNGPSLNRICIALWPCEDVDMFGHHYSATVPSLSILLDFVPALSQNS